MINFEKLMEHTKLTTIQKGKAIFNTNNIISFNIDDVYDRIIIEATVMECQNNYFDVYFIIHKTHGYIIESDCDCHSYHSYAGLCKHCIAVLLNAQMQLQKGHPTILVGFQTNESIKQLLLKEMAPLDIQKNLLYKQKLKLIPQFLYKDNTCAIEFKIGFEKYYVVKNLFLFVNLFENKEEYSYGKNLSFIHDEQLFDTHSNQLFQLIREWTKHHEFDYDNQIYSNHKLINEKQIKLTADLLDRFFEVFVQTNVMAEFNYDYRYLYRIIKNDNYLLPVIIEKDKGGIVVKTKENDYLLLGLNYCYFVYDKVITMIHQSKIKPILPFIQNVFVEGKSVFIAKEDGKAFHHVIYPKLKQYTKLETTGYDEKSYLLKIPQTSVYIDVNELQQIIIKILLDYDDEQYNLFDKQETGIRNVSYENNIIRKIQGYVNYYNEVTKCVEINRNDDLMFDLIQYGIQEIQQWAIVYVSDNVTKLKPKKIGKSSIGISITNNLLSISIQNDEFSKSQLLEIMHTYSPKKKYYRLKDGQFIQFQDKELLPIINMKKQLNISDHQFLKEDIQLPTYRALQLDNLLSTGTMHLDLHENYQQLIHSMHEKNKGYSIPKQLQATLRDYQKLGFQWLKTLQEKHFGGILADDMGLGKTIQIITLFCDEYTRHKKCNSIIVTPASLSYNWKYEFDKFAPHLQVVLVSGNATERKTLIQQYSENTIFITSYDLLKRDFNLYEQYSYAIQVIDEAQYIKNPNTLAAKAVKKLNANYKVALTGTPVENKLSELWSIFEYLMPGFLFSSYQFKEQYETPIVREQDPYALKQLQEMVTPFILRRKKYEVLKDLPSKIEENKMVVAEKEQAKIYQLHAQQLVESLQNSDEHTFHTSKIQVLAQLTKLRQICCDPSLLFHDYHHVSGKMNLCLELIHNAIEGGHKILLFSQFTSMLELIQKRLTKEKISFYSLTGSTSQVKRTQYVKDFNEDDTSVFCISLKAGGTGLNLTSADIVIHFDPWWNSAVQDQASDRAHRIGQTQVVTVYKLIMQGTIEEKIMELQDMKKELADQILSGEGIQSHVLNKDDLIKLLK